MLWEIETEHPLSGCLGYLLRRHFQEHRTHLPVDLHRYLCQGASAELSNRKNALVAADRLNDRVLPFDEEHDVPLLLVLVGRGTEYCASARH